ncbi:diguanylate cyclase [Anaerobacillus sp. HL2]|nr:diguanylate cyclase [Anaerobacillus sp. HL2]
MIGDKGTVGRFGGDEFTIILPNIQSEKEIMNLITVIFKKFTELPIMCVGRELFIYSKHRS